ncbi:hypothetical protein [Algihabitans albus]|uniref:hypothetical protein n=1 Tax=Algihabitans albus TaxID=2164067 RepID=UPI000E5CF4EE|nr:hypothetical protein [Algihabitans albus]
MRAFQSLICLAAALLLTACAGDLSARYGQTVLERVAPDTPAPDSLVYCSGHGCAERHTFGFSSSEWQAIAGHFEPPPVGPEDERRRLAEAAATFETIAGQHTDTGGDEARTFAGFGSKGQLDCIDEAVNMTQLARLLAAEDLLRYHTPGLPVQRGNFIDSWPHYAASLHEEASGQSYVLDGWYRDNGEPALVLPTKVWRAGIDEPLLACLRTTETRGAEASENAALCYGG